MANKRKPKIYTPDTNDGRFVGFRLKVNTPQAIFDRLNEINTSDDLTIGEYFVNLAKKDIFSNVKDKSSLDNDCTQNLTKKVVPIDEIKVVVENLVKDVLNKMNIENSSVAEIVNDKFNSLEDTHNTENNNAEDSDLDEISTGQENAIVFSSNPDIYKNTAKTFKQKRNEKSKEKKPSTHIPSSGWHTLRSGQ